VDAGFLVYDHGQQGYRLASVCLSLALSYRAAQSALDLALPLMRGLAEGRRINVGLAVLDQTEMVYLDSVRLSRLGIFRRLVPGSRIPVALTSLGRAFMASMPAPDRRTLMDKLAEEHRANWPTIHREIRDAHRSVKDRGYCWAQWQTGSVAIATPVKEPTGQLYALNISLSTSEPPSDQLIASHGELLRILADSIEVRWKSG